MLDAIWINVLEPGGFHTGHIHPNAVVSGTYYVAVPDGASALKLEDPRLPMMMARPPIKAKGERPFVALVPAPGTLLLWESFLRHEVPLNAADANGFPSVSITPGSEDHRRTRPAVAHPRR